LSFSPGTKKRRVLVSVFLTGNDRTTWSHFSICCGKKSEKTRKVFFCGFLYAGTAEVEVEVEISAVPLSVFVYLQLMLAFLWWWFQKSLNILGYNKEEIS